MPRKKKVWAYRVKEAAAIPEGGLAVGELIHPSHPYAKKYRDFLEEVEEKDAFKFGGDVEQATAAPGEKRGK